MLTSWFEVALDVKAAAVKGRCCASIRSIFGCSEMFTPLLREYVMIYKT